MKTYLDCFPCFMKQALRAGRMATDDERLIKCLLDEVGKMIEHIPVDSTPPETGGLIYKRISELTGNPDPYKSIKDENMAHATTLVPVLKERIRSSEDSLLTAVRLAVAGNVIDLGVEQEFDIVRDVETILHQEFAIFDYPLFINTLQKAEHILYIGDNSGEAVFDRLLIEELGKPVTFVVRDIPVINDITTREADILKISNIAEVMSSGTTAPGTILNQCNSAFKKQFNDANMIISKGQGNYEGLSGSNRQIFFLLKAKCPVIAHHIGVKESDIVLMSNSKR